MGMHDVTMAEYPFYKENEPKGNFQVAADGKTVHLDGTGAYVSGSVTIAPVSLVVLYRQ